MQVLVIAEQFSLSQNNTSFLSVFVRCCVFYQHINLQDGSNKYSILRHSDSGRKTILSDFLYNFFSDRVCYKYFVFLLQISHRTVHFTTQYLLISVFLVVTCSGCHKLFAPKKTDCEAACRQTNYLYFAEANSNLDAKTLEKRFAVHWQDPDIQTRKFPICVERCQKFANNEVVDCLKTAKTAKAAVQCEPEP